MDYQSAFKWLPLHIKIDCVYASLENWKLLSVDGLNLEVFNVLFVSVQFLQSLYATYYSEEHILTNDIYLVYVFNTVSWYYGTLFYKSHFVIFILCKNLMVCNIFLINMDERDWTETNNSSYIL